MIRLVLDLVFLFSSGAQVVLLPGIPVAIQPVDNGYAVACRDPSLICIVDTDFLVEPLDLDLLEPRDLCVWDSQLVASDFAAMSLVFDHKTIPLPGNPDGICDVFWTSHEVSELAVALFEPGAVVLVQPDGAVTTLVELPGAKSLSPCDADGDGDVDLFASGCGSGVVFIENVNTLPVVHYVGNIKVGVKRCCAADMDGDGLTDVAGIACAQGGAGWWRNPGNASDNWVYHEIDDSLEGPKGISSSGDSLVIASLFSETVFTFNSSLYLPGGFTCCYISGCGEVVMGHKLGFLVRMSVNGGFE